MKALLVLILSLSVQVMAQTAEPQPTPGGRQETPDVKGAIKFEDKPAVPPGSLNDTETQTPPPPPAAPAATNNGSGSGHHFFGVHGALGFPHPLNYGLTYVHDSGLFSAQIATGTFKHTVDEIQAQLDNTELGLRWHPWAGNFFAGVLYGKQTVRAEKTEDITGFGDVRAWGKVTSDYVTPHVGWMWGQSDGGFFTSFEIGYQSPTNVKVDVDSDAPSLARATPEYRELEREVRNDAEKYGKMGLPSVALLKIGWLF